MTAKIYAVTNRKGGVGKTTTSVTLAHGLALKLSRNGGGRVLIIDVDPQGNVAPSLGVKPKAKTLSHFLLGDYEKPSEVIVAADRKDEGFNRPGLFIIPADDSLADAKQELINRAVLGRRATPIKDVFVSAFGDLVDSFTYIIIDCPPSLDTFRDAVYNFADACIVPVEASYLAALGTQRQTEDILDAHEAGQDILIECVVPTKYQKREVLANKVLDDLRAHYGASHVADPIPDTVEVEKSPAMGGLTIFEHAPHCEAAKAYGKLVERIYHVQ